jgi:hypothetical protein
MGSGIVQGVQEFRSSGVQEFRSSGVQEFSCHWEGLAFVKPDPFNLPDLWSHVFGS